jgi:hypothetical protein
MLDLQNYFSVFDKYAHDFLGMDEENQLQFELILSSEYMTSQSVEFASKLKPVEVVIPYIVDSGYRYILQESYSLMYIDDEENEKPTSCSICSCEAQMMTKVEEEDEEAVIYAHRCDFSPESIMNVIQEVKEDEVLQESEDYLQGLQLEYNEQGQVGFSFNGAQYVAVEEGVFHYHFSAEEIHCYFCSKGEPVEEIEGGQGVIQLCPLLTKHRDKILNMLNV